MSVQGGWYHRDFHNLRRRDNTLQTFADYTPFTLYSPIDGTPITYYNVSAAKRDRRSTTWTRPRASDRKMWFNGFEYNFNARLPHGITHVRRRHERASDRPGLRRDSRTRTCCSTAIRPRAAFRSARSSRSPASVPITYGIQVGFSFQSLPGYGFGTGALSGREGGPTGPTGQPSATQLNTPNGVGTVWLITPTTTLHGERARAWRRARARSASWSIRA